MAPTEPDSQLPARDAQEHTIPHQKCGTGLCPHPSEGHHSQGCSLPLQPVSIWPCCGKCLTALAELSQMDGAMHTPGRRGSACPQTRDASFTPPALLLALGSHPANLWHPYTNAVGLGETLPWGSWDHPLPTSQSSPTHWLRTKDVGHAQRNPEPQNAD